MGKTTHRAIIEPTTIRGERVNTIGCISRMPC
jgi:hypothetical protein